MKLLPTLFLFVLLSACGDTPDPSRSTADPAENTSEKGPKIVFVTGDEEYRSEESMPMLGAILERELNAEIKVAYSMDSTGTYVDPNNVYSISGLEELADADLMVVFARFRQLPAAQTKMIADYAESGRPMMGFRTATHAFKYVEDKDSAMMVMNDDWPTRVFGQQWIMHHGHFEDGHGRLTDVSLTDGRQDHPILNGVEPFEAYSWLYHVDGGDWKLAGDSDPLLMGHSLRSKREAEGQLDKYPLDNPVAWTKSYTGESGKPARVFFTTLGHPYDFREESMRKLALNGAYWALGMEAKIPDTGVKADFATAYEPNNSGFGDKFKKNLEPTFR